MLKKSLFKRIVGAAAAAACLFTSLRLAPADTATEAKAMSGLNAFQITEQMQIGWNLGNSLDATGGNGNYGVDTEISWGNPRTTQAMIDTVKAKGFNTVRIPTTWYPHLDGNNQIDPAWMARVKEVVDYCINDGMYVILNVHHEEWVNAAQFNDQTYQNAEAKITAIWTQVAETFKDYDQHLVFEGMNEPRQTGNPSVSEWGNGSGDGGYTWNYINKLNAKFVEAVRGQGSAANSERLLMLPGYCASSDMDAIRAVTFPANSGNVAYSVHAYLPYFFTMAEDSMANHNYPGKSGWGEDYQYALNTFFNNLKQLQNEKNIPVVIGEFSSSNFNNTSSRVAWAKDYITFAKQAGIPCVLWDNNVEGNNGGESHGYLNRSNNTWYPASEPVVNAMIDVIRDDSILWAGHQMTVIPDTTTTEPPATTTEATTTAPIVETTTTQTSIDTTMPTTELTTTEPPVTSTTPEISYPMLYPIDISGYDRSGELKLYFKGTPNANFNGCVGFDDNGEWTQLTFNENLGNGECVVTVPMNKIPENVSICEVQIWWSSGSTILNDYEITGNAIATTTTQETTTVPTQETTASTEETTATSTQETTTTTAPVGNIIYGDANCDGKVTVADAVAILQSIGNKDKYELKPEGRAAADVDGVDGITPMDALVIQQVDAGIYKAEQLPLKAS